MHPNDLVGHIALRVDVAMKGRPRIKPDQLDAADLDNPIAIKRQPAGGFGIEHHKAHGLCG
jgi:hypothetical protein